MRDGRFFQHEPRNEAWAADRERFVIDLALPGFREINPNTQITAECHTGVCRISIHSRKYFNIGLLGGYPLSCLADTAVPEFGPAVTETGIDPSATDPSTDIYLFFGQRSHDTDAAEEVRQCAKARARFLDNLEQYRARTR